ncbi:putative ribonuclease H-like domain-containing protein [Tanacetum coccineum]|uniref:Ribonuclease H-like domain-containing protein n=1 Tax=Tanacetum coccineum TaxID=301880 RepID=A0ABQ5GAJ2_9ASTR
MKKTIWVLVTTLNTNRFHLVSFDGKADEGFFVGYSTNSKAFRVFNSRTRIVEENLHVQFSENTPNIAGSGPNWLFDIDALTNSMNYKPVVAGNQSNGNAGTKACADAGKARVETVPGKDYILLPLWTQDPPFSSSPKDSPDAGFKPSREEEKKDAEDPGNEGGNPSEEGERINQEKDASVNSTNNINTVSPTVNAASIEDNVVDENIVYGCADDPNIPDLEEIGRFSDAENDDSGADINNLDTYFQVSPVPTTRIHKDHPLNQVIGDLQSATQTRQMTKNLEEYGFVSTTLKQRTSHKDLQNCLFACFLSQEEPKKGKIEGEVYVCQPPGFEDPDFPVKVYKVEKALCGLHQAPRSCIGELSFFLGLQVKQKEDGIFISQDKYVTEILKKFSFSDVKTTSTPIETHKPLLKDVDGKDVDEHMYRSMIGSLMYLTSSRQDIMFVDSPFDLVAYTDSDYAGASLDRKSTIEGCQFLRCRLISWQCKKQTVVANSTTEAEYVAASRCCGQVL